MADIAASVSAPKEPFRLISRNFSLDSATGVKQGDPLGPALFTFAIYEVTSKVKASLNIWYLDAGCIGGDPRTMLSNTTMLRNGLSLIWPGDSKCKLLFMNHTNANKPQTNKLFQDQFPFLSIPDTNHGQLLGSPCIRHLPHYT